MRTELYRHYDADDRLLYVGISLTTAARLANHAHCSEWFDLIVKITIERFPDRQSAAKAERRAIRDEKPIFNRQFVETIKIVAPASKPVMLNGLQTAAMLGIDPKTLRQWNRQGLSPVDPIPGINPPRWHRKHVEQYLNSVHPA